MISIGTKCHLPRRLVNPFMYGGFLHSLPGATAGGSCDVWIVRASARPAVYLYCSGAADSHHQPAGHPAHADRHLSQHQYPGYRRRLELHRPNPGGDGRPPHHALRARADHAGRQHRAHRIDHLQRRFASSRSFCSRMPAWTPRMRRSPRSRNSMLRQLPPGTQPPVIINFSASSVPILQLGLSGKGLHEQQLNDIGLNFLRTAAGHRARRRRAVSLWRQTAARSWSTWISASCRPRAFRQPTC